MQQESGYGSSARNTFITVFLFLIGIALGQSSVVFGVNFSLADFLVVFVVMYLLLEHMLIVPVKPLLFFMLVSVVVLFSSTFFVPRRFPVNPEFSAIVKDYIKLVAVFLYYVVGYSLASMGRADEVLRWFSRGGVAVGFVALLSPILGSRIAFMYHGNSARFQGLMSDPNYFSVLQGCVVAYFLRRSKKDWKTYVSVFIVLVSILMSGSKTGVVTIGVYFLMLFAKRIFQRNLRPSGVILGLAIVILLILITPYTIRRLDDILDFVSSLIPQFERVAVLFRSFVVAVSGGGSSRDTTWQTAMRLIVSSPLVGVGIGTYTDITLKMWGMGSVAHNTYLQIAAEWGLPLALVFFLAVLYESVRASRRMENKTLSLMCRDIVLVLMVGSIAISLNNARLFWLVFGIMTCYKTIAVGDSANGTIESTES